MTINGTLSSSLPKLQPMAPLVPGLSDVQLSLLLPVAVHWITSAVFEIFERNAWFERYRIHTTAEELAKNRVTRIECLRVTLQCQILQILLGLGLSVFGEEDVTGNEEHEICAWALHVQAIIRTALVVFSITGIDLKTIITHLNPPFAQTTGSINIQASGLSTVIATMLYWYVIPLLRLVGAIVIADACMYAIHRFGHTNKWMYKHVHSQHHRLYIPYSWGASYNHPVDSLVTDGLSYAIGCSVAGISTRLSMILFAYASFKNVTDHCGYIFPWNPMRSITGTDAGFHDVHHQSWGLKTNFGAWLTLWDRIFGTLFEDEDEIAKLRLRSRKAAEKQ